MQQKDIDQYLSSFLEHLEESESFDDHFFEPPRAFNQRCENFAGQEGRESRNQEGHAHNSNEGQQIAIVNYDRENHNEEEGERNQLQKELRSNQRIIETNPESKQHYFSLKKGQRFQTHNLGSYFFRFTLQFLKILLNSKQIDRQQVAYIENFVKSKGSLKGFQQLFESKVIRQKCLHFYTSKFVVECILKGGGVGLDKKLVMLKYLEKMRKMLFQQCNGWKK